MKTATFVLRMIAAVSLPINLVFMVVACSNIREMKRNEQAISAAHDKLVQERELLDHSRIETSLLSPGHVVVYKTDDTIMLVFYVKNDEQDPTKAWVTFISQRDHWIGLVVPRSSLITISESLELKRDD